MADSKKVVLIELAKERQFIVNTGMVWFKFPVGEALEGMGPFVEAMRLHAYGEAFAPGFEYKVTAEYSYNGQMWTAFSTDLMAASLSPGNRIGGDYTTAADFGVQIRMFVQARATSGGTGGTLSITAALTFKS